MNEMSGDFSEFQSSEESQEGKERFDVLLFHVHLERNDYSHDISILVVPSVAGVDEVKSDEELQVNLS